MTAKRGRGRPRLSVAPEERTIRLGRREWARLEAVAGDRSRSNQVRVVLALAELAQPRCGFCAQMLFCAKHQRAIVPGHGCETCEQEPEK